MLRFLLCALLSLVRAEPPATPACVPHPEHCSGLCRQVGSFVKMQRDGVAEGRGWSWYYDAVAKYATCVNARVWVEVGAAWGSLARHMLLHAPTIQEYHIVDPFLGGYDKADPMSKQFAMAVANRSLDDISHAWARHIGWALGTSPEANAGCRLRIHRLPSVDGAKLFANKSVDVVFVDGLHSYEGVRDDIVAWASKTRPAGALVFNDFPNANWFPGIRKAVFEEVDRRGLSRTADLRFINPEKSDNAVLGGDSACAQTHKKVRKMHAEKKKKKKEDQKRNILR